MDEQTIAGAIAILLVGSFFLYILYAGFQLLLEATKSFRNELALNFQHSVKANVKSAYESYLQNFSYYQKLPDPLKTKFILRVKNFIANKTFETREDLQITDEMKVLVAASAVQLTFGLNKYLLDRFEKIILFPDSYYSPLGKAYHMGETNPRGVIVLSWQDLVNGYLIKDDAFNVGLHEMAHALELELLLQDDYDIYFGTYFFKWSNMAKEEFENVQNERESFLRQYAGTNAREFFAVCIEYFFEASAEFKNRLPQIYYHLCVLLNQDPLRSDTLVEMPKREQFEVLREAMSSYTPVFMTKHSWMNLPASLLMPPVIFVLMGLSTHGLDFAFLPLLFTFFVLIGYTLFKLNDIVLYDNYLVVQNVFRKITAVYYLDDIVSVSLNSASRDDSMKVVLARDGRILKHSHLYTSKSKYITELAGKLKQKNVLVK